MKRVHILPLTLIAFLFSACSSLTSIQENPQSASNHVAESLATDAAENQKDAKLKSTFANVESEGTNFSTERSTEQQTANDVCPDPNEPCKHKEKEFADWELSFRLPAKIKPNKTYSSAPFYAVLLKTYESVEDCDGGEYIEAIENERKEVQELEPDRKVFASYGCPNMDAVGYEFEGRRDATKEIVLIDNFIAIYAGKNAGEAESVRRSMRDDYPKAVIKRMTVNWERIEQ